MMYDFCGRGADADMEQQKQQKSGRLAVLWQFIKFGLVGAFNTVLNYLIYNFCY